MRVGLRRRVCVLAAEAVVATLASVTAAPTAKTREANDIIGTFLS